MRSTQERYQTKQTISYSGQNDISNSVWVDTQMYAAKKRPDLLLQDLDGTTRNGKREQGKSPFDKNDFIRADVKPLKVQLLQQMKK